MAVLEQIQLSTILTELVFVNILPLKPDVAINAANTMEVMVSALSSIYKEDELFNTKMYRILDFVE